jgi:hypothetical protein
MTIASSTGRIQYNGNGTTLAFTVPFYFLDNSHLQVVLTSVASVDTVQTITTNYTVSGSGNPAGGTVTMIVAPASGEKLTVIRSVPLTQSTDLVDNDPLPAEVLETALDKGIMIDQQIQEQLDRAIKVPVGAGSGTLPSPQAGALIGWNGTATGLANYDASSAVTAATNVNFVQGGSGGVSRDVQTKLRELPVTPYEFGCVAGTAADQTSNMQLSVNRAAAAGVPLDLLGLSWRVDGQLTIPSNTEICNGTLDASFAPINTKLMVAAGTLGSGITFTAVGRGAGSLALASNPGWTRGDFVYLRSTDSFGSGGTHRGEWARVNTCTTTLTPYGRTLDAYTTSPQVFRPTLVENITLRNLRLLGRGNTFNQYAAQFYLCRNVHIEDLVSDFFGDRHIEFNRCVDSYVSNSTMSHCDTATGLAYGVVVAAGCNNITVTGCSFRDMRHGVTAGSNDGVDRNVTVIGCNATDCTDAGFDTHPHTQFVVFSGNTINGQGLAAGGSGDGIVMQGANQVCTGNTVMGFTRAGIFIQNLVTNSAMTDDNAVVNSNSVSFPTGSGPIYGIAVENQRTVNGWRFSVTGNAVDVTNVTNSNGIWCEIVSGGSTNSSMAITGNQVYARRNALMLQTATLKLMRTITITGNALESLDTTTYDALFINSATANYIERAIIVGNSIHGGRYGINNTNGQRIKADANMIQAFGTAGTNGTFVGTNDNYTL